MDQRTAVPGPDPAGPDDAADAGLIGRRAIVADVARDAAAARDRRGRVVLLTGEPGIGKTAVATAVARWSARRGARILWGSCWAGTGVPGLWPWIQVVRALVDDVGRPAVDATLPGGASAALSRLVPDVASPPGDHAPTPAIGGSSDQATFLLFDAVATALVRSADERPLVVVLDDLQWADDLSLRLLAFLAGRIAMAPVLVIGAYRDLEIAGDAIALVNDLAARATSIPLAGLGASEVAALMRQIAEHEPGSALARDVFDRTGGNPFFVHQVTRLLLSQAGPDGGLRATLPAGIPAAVRPTIERRLARVSQGCASTLAIASVIGPDVPGSLLVRCSESTVQVFADLEEAVRARILVAPASPSGSYHFVHDLVREVVYAGLEPGAGTALHARVADALEAERDAGGDVTVAQLAGHFALGGAAVKALHYSVLAAEAASARLTYDEAATHYERALELLGDGVGAGDRRSGLLVAYAESLRRAGRGPRARDTFLRAASLARRDGNRRALARAALGVRAIGVDRWAPADQMIDLLEEAAAGLDSPDGLGAGGADDPDSPDGTGDGRGDGARVLAALARELAWTARGPVERARALADRAVDAARRDGDLSVLATCLLAKHNALWEPGTAEERLTLAAEIARLAAAAGDEEMTIEGQQLHCMALLELGDEAAIPALRDLVRAAEGSRLPLVQWRGRCRHAALALVTGDFDGAERLIAEAAALGHEIGEPDAWNVAAAQLADLRAVQGRLAELVESWGGGDVPATALDIWIRSLQAMASLERGDAEAAVRTLRPVLDASSRVSTPPWARLLAVIYPAEPAIALGLEEPCRRFYDALAPYEQTTIVEAGIVRCCGSAALYLGRLARVLGRASDAAAHLERALAVHERMGAEPLVARTRFELALALLDRDGAGDRARAVTLLADAEGVALRLGMPVLARLAAAAREAAGSAAVQSGVFVRDGDVWTLTFEDATVRTRDRKGLHDIAALLARPGEGIPVVDLVVAWSGEMARADLGLGQDLVLDERARREYRDRLTDLDSDLREAERNHDGERAARVRAERDVIVDELAAATGLGGRRRRLGDPRERARKAVAARINDAMRHIEEAHPRLGQHLRSSISTGAVCTYAPVSPTAWIL